MLVICFKSRGNILVLYILAAITLTVTAYRLYILLLKSHMFDDTVYRVSIMLDFGTLHLLIFFITTAIYWDTYFFFFVIVFMPVICVAGLFIKERAKKVWMSRLMNTDMLENDEGSQVLCFLYLIFLYTNETEGSWSQLIRL